MLASTLAAGVLILLVPASGAAQTPAAAAGGSGPAAPGASFLGPDLGPQPAFTWPCNGPCILFDPSVTVPEDGVITAVHVRAQAEVSISVVSLRPDGDKLEIGDGIVPIGDTASEGISSFDLDMGHELDKNSMPGILVSRPGPRGMTLDGYNEPDEEIGMIEPVPGAGEKAEAEMHGGLQLAVRYRFTARSEALVQARETCTRLRKVVEREKRRIASLEQSIKEVKKRIAEMAANPSGEPAARVESNIQWERRWIDRFQFMISKARRAIREAEREMHDPCRRLDRLERRGEPHSSAMQSSTVLPGLLSGALAAAAMAPTTCERVKNRLRRANLSLNRAGRALRRATVAAMRINPRRIAGTLSVGDARRQVGSRLQRFKRGSVGQLRRSQRSIQRSTRLLATLRVFVRSSCSG